MEKEELSSIVEALIFVSGDPVPIKRLMDVLEKSEDDIKESIDMLSQRYIDTDSGIQVMEVAGGYQIRTKPLHSVYVNRFLERKKVLSLSGPALETIAIIAYKQPITRAEIEAIRGVGVDGVLKSLLDKRLVKVAGVKEVPGRPNLYGTTKRFLEYFGIKSLKDLPPIENLADTFTSGSAREEVNGSEEDQSDELPKEESQAGAEETNSGDQENSAS